MYQRIGVITFIAYALPAIFDIALPLLFRSSSANAAACMGPSFPSPSPSSAPSECANALWLLASATARKRTRAHIFLARHRLRFNCAELCDMLGSNWQQDHHPCGMSCLHST